MLKSAFDPVYGKRTVNYDLAYVSYYVEDGDYFKLDNATLGYTIPAAMLGAPRPARVRTRALYVSGRNLFTFTGYKGMDPEVSHRAGLTPGQRQPRQYPTIAACSRSVMTFCSERAQTDHALTSASRKERT